MLTLRASNGPPVPVGASHGLLEMDREMRNASEGNDVDFEDKLKLYQQVLWRYLKRFDQHRDKPLGLVVLKRLPDNLFDPATKVDGGADSASAAPHGVAWRKMFWAVFQRP